MKVTLDTNCINIYENSILDKIFNLAEQEIIIIHVTDALIFDVLSGKEDIKQLPKSQQISALKRITKAKKYPILKSGFKFSSPYNAFSIKFFNEGLFENIKNILPQSVDEEDIRHLVAHKDANNDIFITNNTKHFINNRIRDNLMDMGICVKTPSEFLNLFVAPKKKHINKKNR